MPVYNELFETDESGLGTLDRGDQPKAITETLIWLNYVSQLDPDDESGAFLIPADLKAVDEAYARLQLSDPGTPNFPGNQTRVASSADDDFIKQKMATAIERAQKVTVARQEVSGLDRVLERIPRQPTFSVKVVAYQIGWISGKCLVLLPTGKTIEKDFKKEKGWEAEVEIFSGKEKTNRIIYARGICMNVVIEEAIKQMNQPSTYDYSNIQFEAITPTTGHGELLPKTEALLRPSSEAQFSGAGYPEEAPAKEGFLKKLGKLLGL